MLENSKRRYYIIFYIFLKNISHDYTTPPFLKRWSLHILKSWVIWSRKVFCSIRAQSCTMIHCETAYVTASWPQFFQKHSFPSARNDKYFMIVYPNLFVYNKYFIFWIKVESSDHWNLFGIVIFWKLLVGVISSPVFLPEVQLPCSWFSSFLYFISALLRVSRFRLYWVLSLPFLLLFFFQWICKDVVHYLFYPCDNHFFFFTSFSIIFPNSVIISALNINCGVLIDFVVLFHTAANKFTIKRLGFSTNTFCRVDSDIGSFSCEKNNEENWI